MEAVASRPERNTCERIIRQSSHEQTPGTKLVDDFKLPKNCRAHRFFSIKHACNNNLNAQPRELGKAARINPRLEHRRGQASDRSPLTHPARSRYSIRLMPPSSDAAICGEDVFVCFRLGSHSIRRPRRTSICAFHRNSGVPGLRMS